MLDTLSRYWWLIALRGAVAVLFGILAFVWPGITIGALILLFGAYSLLDGIGAIVTGIAHRQGSERLWPLLEGLAGIVIGIVTFVWPGVTAVVLLILIASWAIITGVFEILAAIRLRQEIEGEWVLVVTGVLSILFGAIMFLRPGAGALALIWVIGGYAIVFGLLLIYLGFTLRRDSSGRSTLAA